MLNEAKCSRLNSFLILGFYACANFGENRSKNATVRVLADGLTHTDRQIGFIIFRMLYAIAMGQIINKQIYGMHSEMGSV